MATFTITADSTPVYDGWGWDDYWSCEDWISWHKALKEKFGKASADLKWIDAWNAQSIDASPYNWCKYGTGFNSYVNKEGLPVTHLLADVISGGTKVGENLIDTATNASGIPVNIAKILKVAIPIVLVLAIVGFVIWAYKKYN